MNASLLPPLVYLAVSLAPPAWAYVRRKELFCELLLYAALSHALLLLCRFYDPLVTFVANCWR